TGEAVAGLPNLPRRRTLRLPSAQYGAYTRQQFPQAEGLCDVVVRTQLQADDAVGLAAPVAGDHDDGRLRRATEPAYQVEPVLMRELHVQNDQIHGPAAKGPGHAVDVRYRTRPEVLTLQIVHDHVPHRRVVIDHENMPRRGGTRRSAPGLLGTVSVFFGQHRDSPP